VLIDQGREFPGAFMELLDDLGIRHRRTARDSPQTHGLAKKLTPPRLWCTPLPRDWDDTAAWAEAGRALSAHAASSKGAPAGGSGQRSAPTCQQNP